MIGQVLQKFLKIKFNLASSPAYGDYRVQENKDLG